MKKLITAITMIVAVTTFSAGVAHASESPDAGIYLANRQTITDPVTGVDVRCDVNIGATFGYRAQTDNQGFWSVLGQYTDYGFGGSHRSGCFRIDNGVDVAWDGTGSMAGKYTTTFWWKAINPSNGSVAQIFGPVLVPHDGVTAAVRSYTSSGNVVAYAGYSIQLWRQSCRTAGAPSSQPTVCAGQVMIGQLDVS